MALMFLLKRNDGIRIRHFTRWIETFSATVDSSFQSKNADAAKQNAEVIGYTFRSKSVFQRQ